MSQPAAVAPACPRFDEFDPLEPAQVGDPFEVLARARRTAPVFHMPKYDMWCVTRHADVLALFKDTTTFSSIGAGAIVAPRPPGFEHVIPDGHPVANSLHSMDPPAHTRVRKLAQKAFTPKLALAREPEIRAIADDLVDAFIDDDEADVVEQYAGLIPCKVIAAILGMPIEDSLRIKQWTDEFFMLSGNAHLPEDENRRLWSEAGAFAAYIREHVERRRAEPQDDLTSSLVHAKSDDGSPSLSDSEVVNVISGLVAAGSDTTSVLIAEALELLLTHPDQLAEVRADPGLLANAVEETLRMRSPVRGLRRVTTRDTVLGGVAIPKNSVIYVQIGAASRDEAVFEDPDRFDIHRPNARNHLGLGIWTHYCLGANLAKVETRVGLECLIERAPGMRRIPQELRWSRNSYVPALLGMRVALR